MPDPFTTVAEGHYDPTTDEVTITATPHPLIDAVRQVAAERPDYVYEAEHCQYALVDGDDVQPGCIIGQALHRLGLPLAELVALDGYGDSSIGALICFDLVPFVPALSGEETAWLGDVQRAQDGGNDGEERCSWAEAVKQADVLFT